MLNLLNIPTNYWTRYIYVETTSSDTDQSQKVSSTSYFGKRSININYVVEMTIIISVNQNHFCRNTNFTARKRNITQAFLRNTTNNTNIKTLSSCKKRKIEFIQSTLVSIIIRICIDHWSLVIVCLC